ncbi:MAG: biopolymer transporter ExbD [Cyanobacteria bacterium P01_F01_bin.3]
MKVDMNDRQSDVQIEILPMIDVIFCILTFFVLAALGLSRQQAIELTLPSVNNSVPLTGNARDRLYVSIDSVGQVYLESNLVPVSLLRNAVSQYRQEQPNGMIVLYAATSARYEDVITVLDLLKSVGGDRVALATLPKEAVLDPTQGSSINPNQSGQPIAPGQPVPGTNPATPTPGGGFPSPSGTSPSPSGTGIPPVSPSPSPGTSSIPVAPPISGDGSSTP